MKKLINNSFLPITFMWIFIFGGVSITASTEESFGLLSIFAIILGSLFILIMVPILVYEGLIDDKTHSQ